jgi:hypothetical protein
VGTFPEMGNVPGWWVLPFIEIIEAVTPDPNLLMWVNIARDLVQNGLSYIN